MNYIFIKNNINIINIFMQDLKLKIIYFFNAFLKALNFFNINIYYLFCK